MPCSKCSSDFNFFNWKIKCGECCDKFCSKCMKKNGGILYCEKCMILLMRPPDKAKLMQLKPKDLQNYLTKYNISTHGVVEKEELVNLLCNKHLPVKAKKGTEKLTANFAGSVPNLRPTEAFNELFSNFESVFPKTNNTATETTPPQQSSQQQSSQQESPRPQSAPAEPQPTTSKESPPKYPKLSDYDNIDDLAELSPKNLKILLTLNRVDYKGCCEKSELLERVQRLWIDNCCKEGEGLPENVSDLCKLCMDAPLDCVLLECGHIATCIDCGKKLAECPICRQFVIRVVRTFKA